MIDEICLGNTDASIIVNVVINKYLFPNNPPKIALPAPSPENKFPKTVANLSEIATITNDNATVKAMSLREISFAPQYFAAIVLLASLSDSDCSSKA